MLRGGRHPRSTVSGSVRTGKCPRVVDTHAVGTHAGGPPAWIIGGRARVEPWVSAVRLRDVRR
ncbi:hypothetical protein KTU01_30530 [Kocuria turfanensis]|uniref:Uncharacterized protein n=1 Tax=Kocuria turfanensis TaxID=388357 RepID=A0A512IGY5_9MICC|nr:hypothetical protein KTU01_30530 [Kocuria turfanensis]